MTNKATLNKLIAFVSKNDEERAIFDNCKKDVLNEYLEDTKSTWSKGMFYLGGFIKMNPDDEITIEKIVEVKQQRERRYNEYGGPCNSWEAASIFRSERQLNEMEEIIQKYTEILKCRYLKELEKTKLNNDVNNVILSFTI